MDTKKLRRNLKKKIQERRADYPFFGEMLRRAREEKGMTQEEVSRGILCDTYYSKIENNKIEPKPYYIAEVGERLGLDFTKLFNRSRQQKLFDDITCAVLYSNRERLCTHREAVRPFNHPLLNDLVDLALAVVDGKTETSTRIIERNEAHITAMPEDVGAVIIILAAVNAYDRHQYDLTIELLNTSAMIPELSGAHRTLEHYYLFLAKQQLGLKLSSLPNYVEASNLLARHHHPDKLLELRLQKVYYMMQENIHDAQMQLEQLMMAEVPEAIYNMYHYVHARLLFMHTGASEMTMAHLDAIEMSRGRDWYFKSLVLRCQIAKETGIGDMKTLHEAFASMRRHDPAILEKVHFTIETTDDIQTLKTYLTDVAVPLASERQDTELMRIAFDKLVDIATATNRYKEGLAYKRKYEKMLKRLQSAT